MAQIVEKSREVFRRFLAEKTLDYVKQSYEYFINQRINDILGLFPIRLNDGTTIILSNASLARPTRTSLNGALVPLMPSEARRDYLTYCSSVYCTMSMYDASGRMIDQKDNVFIGKIPTMIGSSLDYVTEMTLEERFENDEPIFEPGGYFIIEGTENAILNTEKLQTNEGYMYADRKKKSVVIRSTIQTDKDSNMAYVMYDKDSVVYFSFSLVNVHETFNVLHILYVLYKILTQVGGVGTDNFIDFLLNSLSDFVIDDDQERKSARIRDLRTALAITQSTFYDQAYDFDIGKLDEKKSVRVIANGMSKKRPELAQIGMADKIREIRKIVLLQIFPNILPDESSSPDEYRLNIRKAVLKKYQTLCYLVFRALENMNGYQTFDDRDNWGTKRLDTAGTYMETIMIKCLKDITSNLSNSSSVRNLDTAVEQIDKTKILTEYRTFFKSKGLSDHTVVEKVERYNPWIQYALTGKGTVRSNRQGKITAKRIVQNSQFGYMDAVNTPESDGVGIIKDTACTLWVSQWRYSPVLLEMISDLPLIRPGVEYTPVMYNGVIVGFTDDDLVEKIEKLREQGVIPFDISVIRLATGVIRIVTTPGRLLRPLFIVNPMTMRLVIDEKNMWNASFDDMISNGCIEYLDCTKQQLPTTIIAPSVEYLQDGKNYNYCEIDPSSQFGVMAGIIPYINMSQGPRATYQSSMGRQALTVDVSRADKRFDTSNKIANYTAVPLFPTDISIATGCDITPTGRPLILAVMTYGGGNQEDGLIINRGAIERGLFTCTVYHSHTIVLSQTGKTQILLQIPSKGSMEDDVYSKLDPATMIVRVGELVEPGDCIVAKIAKTQDGQTSDESEYLGIGKRGIVDEVYETVDAKGKKVVRIRIKEIRKLQVGDKLAIAQISQKGVCSKIIDEEDMPYVKDDNPLIDGIRPDVIFNPAGYPSRMTYGMMLQHYLGNYVCVTGERIDATPFRTKLTKSDIIAMNESVGLSWDSKYTMIHPKYKVPIKNKIAIGPIYSQQLRHMVADKMQARGGSGKVNRLTFQPQSGIRRRGGLKMGDMSRDALASAGCPNVLRDRMMINSDRYRVVISKKSGQIAYVQPLSGWAVDPITEEDTTDPGAEFASVEIPYSYKLMTQTLAGAGIKVSAILG